MYKLEFHKCRVCGIIFYHGNKTAYCPKCVPSFAGKSPGQRTMTIYAAINRSQSLEQKRARDRARWHKRMEDPIFRERERLRSLARAKADRKYAKEAK